MKFHFAETYDDVKKIVFTDKKPVSRDRKTVKKVTKKQEKEIEK